MSTFAIKGHPTRGSEVIALLEMLGGKNIYNLTGSKEIWYILSNCTIEHSAYLFEEKGFTLEEFEEKFPYKIGDWVIIPDYESAVRILAMKWNGSSIEYQVFTDIEEWLEADDLQPYKEKALQGIFEAQAHCCDITKSIIDKEQEPMEEKPFECIDFAKYPPNTDKFEIILGDYEIKEENGKYYAVKKQSKYPKTYDECCEILDILGNINAEGYKKELLLSLQKLLICRDAYWEIAGEQMGLGKPWEPNWKDDSDKYFICYLKDELWMSNIRDCNRFLVFPTEEMRNAFYKNFKDLIEQCKELL